MYLYLYSLYYTKIVYNKSVKSQSKALYNEKRDKLVHGSTLD